MLENFNSPPPPPVVEICDFECQRQKNLVLLKLALDNTNKESEPEKYEQARIAYYTELNGSAWLEKDKERVELNLIKAFDENGNMIFSPHPGYYENFSTIHATSNTIFETKKCQVVDVDWAELFAEYV